ncbi:MAG: phosphotransferase [Candidatus Manganitrophaceae bacterium]
MIDFESLLKILNGLGRPAEKIDVRQLTGDASNRTYHRISWKENGTTRSLVLMVMAAPERFKASEEAVSGVSAPMTEPPFINIQRYLYSAGVAVPEIFFHDERRGWLLLEDLGDITLADEIRERAGGDETALRRLYERAIDTLLVIQLKGTPSSSSGCLAHHRAFDQPLFLWEFDHFLEYGVEARNGITLPAKQRETIRAYFSDISLRLASLPQVFTHRDYHSRNLMVQHDDLREMVGGRHGNHDLRVIDFQDALMGPPQYDLASLLRDSYIDLPEKLIDDLILYYLQQRAARTGETIQGEMFREYFDLVGLQRNLKAAGRFVYIDRVKKNNRFLQYIPPTLRKVRRTLLKYKRLAPLHDLLAEHVEELRPAAGPFPGPLE